MKYRFLLKGLDCASCAQKIESCVKSIPDIDFVTLNFATGALSVQSNSKPEILFPRIESAVLSVEPDVVLRRDENDSIEPEKDFKSYAALITRFSIGLLLFAAPLILEFPEKIALFLYLSSYALIGAEVLVKVVRNIPKGRFLDENFLMFVATVGAFFIGEYTEAVAVMIFYQIGEFFQNLAVSRSRKSIAALMDIRPDYANLKNGSEIRKVSPESVKIGDTILVRPGEKIPLDGIVISGKSALDTSALTGESLPKDVGSGDAALAGTINKDGVLEIRVTKEFGDSSVSKILDLVQNASAHKAPTENFITKFARIYTPAVVIAAVLMALLPPLLLPGALFSDWLRRALILLVISCPCALVISIPLGYFGGIGGASRQGILIKGGNFLDALTQIDTVVFDKTGTLTKGWFAVTEIVPQNGFSAEELLNCAAHAEAHSSHPIARSVVSAYGSEIDTESLDDYHEFEGFGVSVLKNGTQILAGNRKLMEREGFFVPETKAYGTVVHIAIGNVYAGYLLVSDEAKKDSADTVRGLNALGVRKTVMLTGDNHAAAEKIGKELELSEIIPELLPEQKVASLERLKEEISRKGKLIFVGDGINDAPVLARADVGIAMGGLGSDAAIEAADIVLMTDEPSKILTAIRIARKTKRIITENIALALGIKLIVLLLGSLGMAAIWEAVIADVGVALLAVFNSMRASRILDTIP